MFDDGEGWAACFTEEQRVRLRTLGLYEEQISLLESILDQCRFATYRRPTRQNVRAKIAAVEEPMKKTLRAIEKFLSESTTAADESRFRVRVVDASTFSTEDIRGVEAIERVVNPIKLALSVLKVANGSAKGQQRQRPAKLFPIEVVDHVLREGFRRHHDPSASGAKLPRYKLPISRSGHFRDVVAVCFEAVGYKTHGTDTEANPDRAIREYLQAKKIDKGKDGKLASQKSGPRTSGFGRKKS